MSIDLERIGRRICEERKAIRKISQEKMAEDLGLYQADISNLEHARKGSGIADLLRLDAIASYFDISLESLLFGSDKQKTMPHYRKEKMPITPFSSSKKITKKHCTILSRLTDTPEDIISSGSHSFTCGSFFIHILTEAQSDVGQGDNGQLCITFTLPKLHIYVLFKDELVACMVADYSTISQFIYEPEFRKLQRLIQPDVLDVTDALRTMNPYYPLALLSDDPEEFNTFQAQMYSRMDKLRSISNEAVLFIESIYVLEDCRQKGLCTLLIDILHEISGDCTLWLNMEPTIGEELTSFTPYFPSYTQSKIGQISQNAAIAEKLGFNIDPDCWHGQVESTDQTGNTTYQTVEFRKCAYKLSSGLQKIIADDGDLIGIGRARQKVFQSKHKDNQSSRIVDIKMGTVDGKQVSEMKTTDRGTIWYSFYVHEEDGTMYFAASHHSVLAQGFCIDIIEDCEWFEEKPDSLYYNDWKMLFSLTPSSYQSDQ